MILEISVITITSIKAATLGKIFFPKALAGETINSKSFDNSTISADIGSAKPFLKRGSLTFSTLLTPLIFDASIEAFFASSDAQRIVTSPKCVTAFTVFPVRSIESSLFIMSAITNTDILNYSYFIF